MGALMAIKPGWYSLICPKQGCTCWTGYGFWPLCSKLNRIYNFGRVCPKQPVLIINRVLTARSIWYAGWYLFVLEVYKCNGFKTRQHAFTSCPKQGNEVDGVVLNRVCILGSFCPKRKLPYGFKPSAYHLYPNIGRVPLGYKAVQEWWDDNSSMIYNAKCKFTFKYLQELFILIFNTFFFIVNISLFYYVLLFFLFNFEIFYCCT